MGRQARSAVVEIRVRTVIRQMDERTGRSQIRKAAVQGVLTRSAVRTMSVMRPVLDAELQTTQKKYASKNARATGGVRNLCQWGLVILLVSLTGWCRFRHSSFV